MYEFCHQRKPNILQSVPRMSEFANMKPVDEGRLDRIYFEILNVDKSAII